MSKSDTEEEVVLLEETEEEVFEVEFEIKDDLFNCVFSLYRPYAFSSPLNVIRA